jgi:hypothetical protein
MFSILVVIVEHPLKSEFLLIGSNFTEPFLISVTLQFTMVPEVFTATILFSFMVSFLVKKKQNTLQTYAYTILFFFNLVTIFAIMTQQEKETRDLVSRLLDESSEALTEAKAEHAEKEAATLEQMLTSLANAVPALPNAETLAKNAIKNGWSAAEAVADTVVGAIASTPSFYLYYMAKTNLPRWIDQRRVLLDTMESYFRFILTYRSPSVPNSNVDADMNVFLNYLKNAHLQLTGITLPGYTVIKQAFDAGVSIIKLLEQTRKIASIENFGENDANVKALYNSIITIQTRLVSANSMIDQAMDFIQSKAIASAGFKVESGDGYLLNAQFSFKWQEEAAKAYWEEMKQTILMIGMILNDLAAMLPVPAYAALSTLSYAGNLMSVLGESPSDSFSAIRTVIDESSKRNNNFYKKVTLSGLNKKIASSLNTINDFAGKYDKLMEKKQSKDKIKMERFSDDLLKEYIDNLEKKPPEGDYPANRIDMLLKVPRWLVDLRVLKVSIAAELTVDTVASLIEGIAAMDSEISAFKNNIDMNQIDIATHIKESDLLFSQISASFANLVLMAVSPEKIFNKGMVNNLNAYLSTIQRIKAGDERVLNALKSFKEPAGYSLFEKGLGETMNAVQQILPGAAGIISFIEDGTIMDVIGDISSTIDLVQNQDFSSFLGLKEFEFKNINYLPFSPLVNKFVSPVFPNLISEGEESTNLYKATEESANKIKDYTNGTTG